jgi:hypothetical protein
MSYDPFRNYDQYKTASPYDDLEYCPLCGQMDMRCKCEECDQCGELGRVECIDEHELKPTHAVWYCIEQLTGDQSLREYARGFSKHSFITVGFLLPFRQPEDQPDWVWCDDLPEGKAARDECPLGIAVSSIVEGSDVDLEPRKIEKPFTQTEFDEALDDLKNEVDFYWNRDNSTRILIEKVQSAPTVSAHIYADTLFASWAAGDESPQFNQEELFPEVLKAHLRSFDHWTDLNEQSWTPLIAGYKAKTWIDDSTY